MFYWLFNNVCTSKGAAHAHKDPPSMEGQWRDVGGSLSYSTKLRARDPSKKRKEEINPQVT